MASYDVRVSIGRQGVADWGNFSRSVSAQKRPVRMGDCLWREESVLAGSCCQARDLGA